MNVRNQQDIYIYIYKLELEFLTMNEKGNYD